MLQQRNPDTQSPMVFLMLPMHIDLALHAAPSVFLVLQFFFFEKKYGQKEVNYGAPFVAVLFGTWYVACVEYFARLNGNCESRNHT